MKPTKVEPVLVALLGLSLPLSNFPFFHVRAFGVDATVLLGAALLVAAAAALGLARKSRPFPDLRLLLASAVLLAVPLVPFLFHRLAGFDPAQFWKTWLHLAFFLALFLAVGSAAVSREELYAILAALTCEAAALALYGAWQTLAFPRGWPTGVATLNRLASEPLRGQYGGAFRATAVFAEPKWLGIFLLAPVGYACALALEAGRMGRVRARNAWLLAAAVIAAGVLPTESLGMIPAMALLVLFLAVAVVLHLPGRKERLVVLTVLLLVVAVALGASLFSHAAVFEMLRMRVHEELVRGQDNLGYTSTPGWLYRENFRFSIAVFREAPWFGIGVGQLAKVGSVRGVALGFPVEVSASGPWVGFGGFLAEFGLVGTAALLLLLARLVRRDVLVLSILAAVLLKEVSSGFYITAWTWVPLGLAGLAGRWTRQT